MEKEPALEVPLPQFQNVANFKKLVDISAVPGFLVRGSAVTEWHFEGYRYRDGVPLVYGSAGPGVPLSAVIEQGRDRALASLLAVVSALAALPEEGLRHVDIGPDSVYLLEDGGVLFLPAEAFRKIRMMATDDYKAAWSRFNNPYAENDRQRLSHAVGVLVYRVLTGEFPYDGRDYDELHRRLRHHPVTPPAHLRPELKPAVSDFLVELFTDRRLPVRLPVWKEKLSGWLAGGVTRALDPGEAAELARTAGKFAARRGRHFRLRVFWERRGRTVLAAAAVTAVAGLIVGSIVANALKPRLTAGMSARAVVNAYYRCFNTLETELMRDCLRGDTAAEERRLIEVKFVTTRQIYFTGGQEYRAPADAWEKRGRPPVEPPSYIDGVAGLAVTEDSSSDSAAVFTAVYERWYAEPESDEIRDNTLVQLSFRVKERLSLVRDDRGWLIAKLERLEQVPDYRSTAGYQPVNRAP